MCTKFYDKGSIRTLYWPPLWLQEVYTIVGCFTVTGKHVLVFHSLSLITNAPGNLTYGPNAGCVTRRSIFYKPICILCSANNDLRFKLELQLRIMDWIITHVSSWISRDMFSRWWDTLNAKYSDEDVLIIGIWINLWRGVTCLELIKRVCEKGKNNHRFVQYFSSLLLFQVIGIYIPYIHYFNLSFLSGWTCNYS